MSSQSYPLRSSGIYRNLPTFDPSIRGLKALVCGASGISGFHVMRALLDVPDRWSTIYAASRSPLPAELLSLLTAEQRSRIKHVSLDLSQTSASALAHDLHSAGVTHVDHAFFFSYASPSSRTSAMTPSAASELVELNVPLFANFLSALSTANLTPRRILLQTGGKNYGMHIGRVRTPMLESDPQPEHLQANFYYEQERLLKAHCAAHGAGWNVVRPAAVIGANQRATLNTFYGFGVYAAVQARRGRPLVFGGDWDEWQYEATHSTARLTGYLCEWAVLEDGCKDQAFNAQDGSPLSWDRFFEELARWFDVRQGFRGPVDEKEDGEAAAAFAKHSVALAGGKRAPIGYGPPLRIRLSHVLTDWARDEENAKAWREIMEESQSKEGTVAIKHDPFAADDGYAIFMSDFAYGRFGGMSANKLRRFGFSGFVDTLESVFEMFQEMASMGLLPPMAVDAARPMI